jgi:hypothetical protein
MLLPGGDSDITYRDAYIGFAVSSRYNEALANLNFPGALKRRGENGKDSGFKIRHFQS